MIRRFQKTLSSSRHLELFLKVTVQKNFRNISWWDFKGKSLCRRLSQNIFCEYRSSHRRCSIKKGVLRNFAKLTGKHLCQSLFFNQVAGLLQLIKKETLTQVFSFEFCQISKNNFFSRTSQVPASAPIPRKLPCPKKFLVTCLCFPVYFAKYIRTPFSQKTFERLLLSIIWIFLTCDCLLLSLTNQSWGQ